MRSLPSAMVTALSSATLYPAFLVDITFTTGPMYIWSGVGNLSYGGNTYLGVGQLGKVGAVREGSTVKADGMHIALSGIDSTMLNEALNDVQVGAPCTVYFAALTSAGLASAVYPVFGGTVDVSSVREGAKTSTIVLNLENRLYDLQRPSGRLYTSSDQRYYHPDDNAFSWVEKLNDIALVWG